MQDSVVPLLKYLDTEREKYTVRRESRSYVKLIRNWTKLKRAVAVNREWDSATAMAKEQAASLTAECAAAKATLQEREDQLREKEIECEVLQLNLAKKSERCIELEEVCSNLRVTNENAQKMTMDLCGRLEKSKEVYEAAVKRAERLITTAGKWEQMHAEELARLKHKEPKKRVSPKNFGGRLHRQRRQKKGIAVRLWSSRMSVTRNSNARRS